MDDTTSTFTWTPLLTYLSQKVRLLDDESGHKCEWFMLAVAEYGSFGIVPDFDGDSELAALFAIAHSEIDAQRAGSLDDEGGDL